MEQRPRWAPEEIDIGKPSVARVYDFALGGSHNFAADREFASQVFAAMPDAPQMARDNRAFLRRAVRFLSGEGVDQFLDLGSGIPTVGAVHTVAHEADPQAKVVYVDHDPVAIVHSRELLADDPRILVLGADLRDATAVLDAPEVGRHLDLDRPVAVLFVSVLHFVDDADDPAGIVGSYVRRLRAGSHLAISHGVAETREDVVAAAAVYNRSSSAGGVRGRSTSEVAALFAGARLVDPGLVRMPRWRPESPDDVDADADRHAYLAGVARKD